MELTAHLAVPQVQYKQILVCFEQKQISIVGGIVPHKAFLVAEGLSKTMIDIVEQVH